MQVDEGAAVAEEGLAGHPLESHAFTEEATKARKAFQTCPNLEAKSKNYDPDFVVLALPCQKSRKAVRPSRITTSCQREAMATRKVQNRGPNSDYKREDFDPNFVVLALPCQNSRKAAAPGRIAAEPYSRRKIPPQTFISIGPYSSDAGLPTSMNLNLLFEPF